MLVLRDRSWEMGRGASQGNLEKRDEDLITWELQPGESKVGAEASGRTWTQR